MIGLTTENGRTVWVNEKHITEVSEGVALSIIKFLGGDVLCVRENCINIVNKIDEREK